MKQSLRYREIREESHEEESDHTPQVKFAMDTFNSSKDEPKKETSQAKKDKPKSTFQPKAQPSKGKTMKTVD